MSSHGPSASAHSSSGPDSLLFELLDLESFDPPAIHEELTESSTTTTYDHGSPKCTRECVEDPHAPFTFWNSTDPCEFTSSQVPRPKCAPTAEIFGNLSCYSGYVHHSHQEEEDVLSPLKKRQRRKLRKSAGVKEASLRNLRRGAAGPPPDPEPETSLPPAGRMQCLWGDGCPTEMDFDYTLETIKEWKEHFASHLPAESNGPVEVPEERAQPGVKMVECGWDGCDARVEMGYLFKHIVTHEVRLKLLCSHGCGVAIRDDNLDSHLKSCRQRK